MGLETITTAAGSTIADLTPAWPLGTEQKLQGDDHIRNIKYALQLTFPNIDSTVSSSAAELNLAHKGGTVSGTLFVSSSMTVSGSVHIKGNLSVSGAMNILGALQAGAFGVTADTLMNGKLVVVDTVTVQSTTTFSAAVAFVGGISVSGAATLANTLSVSGATHLKTTLSVGGAAVLGSTLHVDGVTTLSGATHLKSTLSVSGGVIMGGAVQIGNTLSVSGATHLKTTLSVGAAVVLASTLQVGGVSTLNTGVTGSAVDTDSSMAANSDTLVASQKAIKTHVAAQILTIGLVMNDAVSVGASNTITADLSTGTIERVEIAFFGVSLSGTGYPTIQIGTGGAPATSGYVHACFSTGGNQIDTSNFSSGVSLASRSSAAGDAYSGCAILTHLGGNKWQISGSTVKDSSTDVGSSFGGMITLGGELDVVALTTTAGNFDAGSWKVSYQRSA